MAGKKYYLIELRHQDMIYEGYSKALHVATSEEVSIHFPVFIEDHYVDPLLEIRTIGQAIHIGDTAIIPESPVISLGVSDNSSGPWADVWRESGEESERCGSSVVVRKESYVKMD